MLRKVCFQFDQETMDVLRGKMEALLADLAAHGVTVHGLRESEKQAESAECLQTVFECPACGHKTDEIMYITDRGKPYGALRAAGCHVLPCLHEHNREEAFPGAVYAVEKIEETDFASLDMAYRRLAGLPWEILETERLLVRETTPEDVDVFYRIYGEPSVTAYMEGLCEDRDEEIACIESYIDTVYAFYGYGMWTVIKKDSGEIIGRAGISWREGYRMPELGFVIGVPWQGQGYALEVCGAILEYARETLEMKEVQALVRPENGRSVKLCGKLGFAPKGETEVNGIGYRVFVKEL